MYPKLFGVIDSYAFMLVLGVVLGVVLFEVYFRAHLKEKKRVFYLEMCLGFAIIMGMVGAYLFQNIYNLIEDPAHFQWTWSLTFYGGAIFGVGFFVLAFFVFARKHYPTGLRDILRIFPASITAAHALGRIGCFLEGCCYGKPTDAWFGVKFVTTTGKVIPTNLFEAIFLACLCGVLLFLAFKKDSDYAFPIYLMGYGVWRFIIEFFRDDHRGSFIPGISPSQFWSIALFLGGAGLLVIYLIRRNKKPQEPVHGEE